MHSVNGKFHRTAIWIFLAVLSALPLTSCAWINRPAYKPAPENLEAREWFQDAKFGLFIRWGIYASLGEGESVMENRRMSATEYEKLAGEFNPGNYNPVAWVALAKAAGARYITICAKDCDGFGMFRSKATDWDIVHRTPYARDVLAPLAEECKKGGIKLFIYYSALDWHHHDYFPLGKTGLSTGRPEKGQWSRYLNFMNEQLTELLTNYGEVAGVSFSETSDKPDSNWKLGRTYQLIHRLQPAALIGNDHQAGYISGEDFQIAAKEPQEQTMRSLPIETRDTINDSWGYNKNDKKFKTPRDLIHNLVKAAARGSNFLLGVGPMADGTIQMEFQAPLESIGKWLDGHGESIYGTRAGPVAPGGWGVSTRKEDKVYIHYLAGVPGTLAFPSNIGDVHSAYLFGSGASMDVILRDGNYTIEIPERIVDPVDTIIVLKMERAGNQN